MDEARSELTFSRFNPGGYRAFVGMADQVRRRLTAMAEDTSLFAGAPLEPGLVPSLPALAEKTTESFAALAAAVRVKNLQLDSTGLESGIQELDGDLQRLRERRTTAPFALDRMLPFWALVFNLREIAQDLKELEASLPQLA